MRLSRMIAPLSMGALGVWLAAGPAAALESAAVRSDRATATLVSDADAVAAGRTVRVGLRLRLAPGWHTYWRNPGDAGIAPDFPLTLPAGSAAGPVAWPAPERMAEGPVSTYGYVGDLLLPVAVTPGAGPLHVATHASWLVCKEVCVPEEGDLSLDLPVGAPTPSAEAGLFAAADLRTPRPSPFEATVTPDGTLRVSGEALAGTVADAWLLPLEPGAVDGGAQLLTQAPDGFTLALPKGEAFQPGAALSGVLVVVDRSGRRSAFDVSAAPAAAGPEAVPLGRILGLAFLGGLLLNLMPCVFPVLAMKAMAALRAGADRRGALFYTAGVLAAFSALGGALLAARAAGSAAGWGFQFQSPAFVAVTAWVLFAVGLNMSGVFEAPGGRLTGAGQGLASRAGGWGSFFTGLLAVAVAAPCTAPFMGAAVAGALAAPPATAMAVFLTLGLGLAAPYAALACVPALGRAMPRPGRWMDVLKQALAFPMYAASAWLVWVASIQSGPQGVLTALAGLTLVGLAAWAFGLSASFARAGRRASLAVSAAALVAAAALLPGLSAADPAPLATEAGAEPYTAARLAELRAERRPVFVNLTAAWCVTCLVNERVALSPGAVRKAFAERGVAYLKGDWTRADAAVTSLLRQNDRDGVPLYLFYAPGAARPDVLPQILTQAEVLDAVGRL